MCEEGKEEVNEEVPKEKNVHKSRNISLVPSNHEKESLSSILSVKINRYKYMIIG